MEDFLKITSSVNDESRVKILAFLASFKNDMLCVCDLVESLGMIQSRLSRHLKILKEAGFLKLERKGTWAYYGIKEDLNPLCQKLLDEIIKLKLALPELKRISCRNE